MIKKDDDNDPLADNHCGDLWALCKKKTIPAGKVTVTLFEAPDDTSEFKAIVTKKLPEHYIVAKFLKKNGREKIARLLAQESPVKQNIKSGDMGEILATELVNSGHFEFQVPIHRLCYKDAREWAMRGDDIIGFQFNVKPIRFLKGEAKSREKLDDATLEDARSALDNNAGLPQSHSLAFIMQRLIQEDQDDKADLIEEYVLNRTPLSSQVSHLIFTFSENDPSSLLCADAQKTNGTFAQYSVGVKVSNHQTLIKEIYSEAING